MKSSQFIPKPRLVHRPDPWIGYASGRKTLHIGMGGYIDDREETQKELAVLTRSLHYELNKVAASLTGVDINSDAIEIMRREVPGHYVVGDIMDVSLLGRFKDDPFEVIIFGDVIEHLDNFGIALRNLTAMLAPGGIIIISTANAVTFSGFAKMLFRYESTHAEHTCFFSYLTLKRTLEMNELRIIDFMFYTHKRLDQFESWMHRVDHYASNAVVAMLPQFAQGIIAVAQPISPS